jgi:hypothetical protein
MTTTLPYTLQANSQGTVAISNYVISGAGFVSGNSYMFKLITAKGNTYQYNIVAP